MFNDLLTLTHLSGPQFAVVLGAVFFAGMVRGFSGFALSALVMASLTAMIPPFELIAVCWFLEFSAGLLMVRGGIAEADGSIVKGLVIGSVIGAPVGLYFTSVLPIETSKLIALVVIISLAALQLARIRPRFLATQSGLYASGLTAGIATGLASVGGMVVALYVLARDAPARVIRASLVMFLFASNLIGLVYMILYGMMNQTSVTRGLVLIVPCLLGVMVGQRIFRPSLEKYYKPFCLVLLMVLAGAGLVRLGTGS